MTLCFGYKFLFHFISFKNMDQYVKCMCPSHALKCKIMYEICYGHIALVRNLSVIGSIYYALIPKVHINELDVMSQNYTFLWYSNTIEACHFINKVNKKLIISKDVIFLESSKTKKMLSNNLNILIDSLM